MCSVNCCPVHENHVSLHRLINFVVKQVEKGQITTITKKYESDFSPSPFATSDEGLTLETTDSYFFGVLRWKFDQRVNDSFFLNTKSFIHTP